MDDCCQCNCSGGRKEYVNILETIASQLRLISYPAVAFGLLVLGTYGSLRQYRYALWFVSFLILLQTTLIISTLIGRREFIPTIQIYLLSPMAVVSNIVIWWTIYHNRKIDSLK